MDKPIHFTEVVNPTLFKTLEDDLTDSWMLNNQSYDGDGTSWGLRYTHDKISFFEAASVIKLKILKHVREKIQLIKIHANGQTSLQKASFHFDFHQKKVWTFILFTENNWNTQWGGEFISQNPETKEYHYTPYIPNSGVLIPSHWDHYGASPNAYTDQLRTTLAFCYAELKTVDEIIQNHKQKPGDPRHILRFV